MTDKHILIVSNTNDLHALAVRRELAARGCPVSLLACDRLREQPLAYGFGSDPVLEAEGRRVAVRDLSTVWWRRPSLDQRLPEGALGEDQLHFVNTNCRATLRSFLCSAFTGTWVSSPEATDRAADKLHQLNVARRLGLRVPDTLLSNDPSAVRAFHRRHEGRVIIKAARNSGRVFLATRPADVDRLSDAQIRAVPSLYQERIPGTAHLRVNCFGTDVRTALIETDALDWRPDINVPVSAFRLDPALQSQLLALLEALDLRTGVMDLKISDRGEPVWFEVNPQGQFLFLEPLTGQNLLAAFTAFLLGC
ncbi:ATP-grasp domain-containing protein [Streptomyces sp. URMC 127]|uniref:ATP-grasp domain-containing protein n=1 Tax=Streptomyces sp. URMC 127 TaxID=3423402 RepID=UPI003F1B2C0F